MSKLWSPKHDVGSQRSATVPIATTFAVPKSFSCAICSELLRLRSHSRCRPIFSAPLLAHCEDSNRDIQEAPMHSPLAPTSNPPISQLPCSPRTCEGVREAPLLLSPSESETDPSNLQGEGTPPLNPNWSGQDGTTDKHDAKYALKDPNAHVSETSKICTYLCQRKKGKLREVCSFWNLKLGGNRAALIFRCVMLLQYHEKRGTNLIARFEANPKCEDWRSFYTALLTVGKTG